MHRSRDVSEGTFASSAVLCSGAPRECHSAEPRKGAPATDEAAGARAVMGRPAVGLIAEKAVSS